MPSNIEKMVGLQGCYWKINGQTFEPKKGGTYVLYTKDTNEFFVDETCVGGKSKNPKHTAANARWAFIYDIFFQSFKDVEQKNITTNLWGPLNGGTEVVSKYALGTNYKVGNSIAFNPQGDVYYYGYKQRVELFSDSPGTGFYFYIVPVNKPLINFAYFNKSEELKHYGETANLTVMFHGFNFDEKNRYKARVFLFENTGKENALTETSDFEDLNLWDNIIVKELEGHESDSNHNIYLRHNFNINIDWKKGENKKKDFTVAVEVLKTPKDKKREDWKRVDFKNFAKDPTTDLVNYDSKLLKLQDIDKKDSISSRFMVSEELMDQYLKRVEQEKNDMIQYIGDIEYTKREFDPCGYSKITVKDEEDEKRDSFVIFDETIAVGPIDKTKQSFSLIRGDTRKNVSITLDKLTTQDTFCQGLLLDEGQKHSEKKNVFQVNKVYAALKNGDIHVRQIDKTHQDQQKSAGVATNDENKNDTDVVKTNNSKNVSEIQQWKEGIDYKIESNEKITLMLRYMYNKTFLEGQTNKYIKEDVNNFWLFNYFILTEDMAQTYSLPVSTCRYPNQIVTIKVFPSVSWTFHLNYGMKNPLYYRDTWVEMRQHRVEPAVVRAQAADIDGYDGRVETKFGLSIEAKWNEIETAKLDQKISEKVKLLIGSFVKIKQFVDKVTGRDRGNSTEGITGTVLERIKRTPLTIEVLSPQISIGAGWEYKFGRKENGEDNILVPTLGLVAKADPVMGAEAVIDLIAWGKKLHPAAEAVITALDLMVYAANAEIRFDLKFYGKLVIEGNIELSRLKKEGELKAEGQFGFELTLQAKATGKLETWWNEVDYNFEAKAEGSGYFSLGLSAGLDDYKGLYLQPIARHSGIKITLVFKAEIGSINRGRTKTYPIIDEDKLDLDQKYYIND